MALDTLPLAPVFSPQAAITKASFTETQATRSTPFDCKSNHARKIFSKIFSTISLCIDYFEFVKIFDESWKMTLELD